MRVRCARWMSSPGTLFRPLCAPRALERSGALSAARGLPVLVNRSAPKRARDVDGRMEFRPIFVWGVALSSNFRERVCAIGTLSGEIDLRVASPADWRRVIVSRGARVPCFGPLGIRHIYLSLVPTRRAFLGRATMMRICSLLRIFRYRAGAFSHGSSV